jgi:signal transduction histidine kinase
MVEDVAEAPAAASRALHEVVLALARERALEPVLERLVEAARELVAARYAAIGVPDGLGGFAKFIYTGMAAAQVAAIGPLPRVHGLLAAMLEQTASYRTSDITADPRFQYWPPAHPDMRSFLGVPVVSQGEVMAAIYCTDKEGAETFTAADQHRIELLAAHAAVAIDNARLWERSRELVLAEERAATARDLHDALSQRLFSLALTADVARRALPDDPASAAEHLDAVRELVAGVQHELRGLITDLRPADLTADGLGGALRQHTRLLDRASDIAVQTAIGDVDLDPLRARELFLLAQEALHNALRHAGASTVRVALSEDGDAVRLVVSDDGVGFDPDDEHPGHLGLVTMRERVTRIGGTMQISSGAGLGTMVRVEVPTRIPA